MEQTPVFRHPSRCAADHQDAHGITGLGAATATLLDDVWFVSPGGVVNVRDVRRRVREVLGDRHPRVHDAELLASEIATNAITHTATGARGGRLRLAVWTGGDRIRIEITDEGGSATTPVVRNDLDAEDGRGLYLVQQLADGFGTCPRPDGTTVWFELATGSSADGG